MSAIEFIMHGGMASTGGDLPDNEQKLCNDFVKKFGDKIAKLGRTFQIPASQLSIFKMNFLFIGKDVSDYHFVFVVSSFKLAHNTQIYACFLIYQTKA